MPYSPEVIITDARLKVLMHYFQTWGEGNIVVRGIIPNDAQTSQWIHSYVQKYPDSWQVRTLSKDIYAPLVVKYITGYITLIHSRHKGQTIIIENNDLAQAELQNFEMLWERAGEKSDLLKG